jgi:integrase
MSLPKLCWHKTLRKHYVRIEGECVYFPRSWPLEQCQREHLRILTEWQAAGRFRRPGEQLPGVSVDELAEAYRSRHVLTHYRLPDGTATSEQDCIRMALRPLLRLYGATHVSNFGPLALQAVRQAMTDGSWMAAAERAEAAQHGGGQGWCRSVTNAHIGRIVRMFGWGVAQEMVPEGVWRALGAVLPLPAGRGHARERRPVLAPSPERIREVRAVLCRQLQALIDLQVLTGMRPGEVCALCPAEIDRTGASLWFALPAELQGRVWVYRPRSKTAHHGFGQATNAYERIVPISPAAQAVLLPWLERDADAYCFSPAEAEAERRGNKRRRGQRVPGDVYTPMGYSHAVTHACDRTNPDKSYRWHPHSLRHYAAAVLVRTFGPEVARIVLGHATTAMIRERYAREAALERDLLDAFRAISG